MKKIIFTAVLIISMLISGQEVTKEQEQIGTLLETVGVLSAQSVYLTYTSIGTTADGHSAETYDTETALQLLGEYSAISEVARDQLNALSASGVLVGEDITFVNDLIETFNLLIAESNAYGNYINSSDNTYLTVYDDNRNKAWAKIELLLGL